MVKIILDNNKCINIELYEKYAPITCKNFIKLVSEKFYDGLIFHRIIKDFMVQGGGYYIEENNIIYKEAETIKGEFSENGFDNPILHKKGVISMARTNNPDSASSQFFIMTGDFPHLDGKYAAFGKICDEESFEALEYLNNARTEFVDNTMCDFPYPIIKIKEMRIE